MNLYQSISRRKSCRKYRMEPLPAEIISKLEKAIQGFDQLYPDAPIAYRFTNKVKGHFHVEAPLFLVVSGQGAPGEQENAGFVYEQLVLWFDALELGCCWLGASRDAQADKKDKDLIIIGFGYPDEPVHRTMVEFKRKPVEAITNVPQDDCVKAVQLAPSGMNIQPWYFERKDTKTLVYKQKLRPPVSLLYKCVDIDLGIALSHYALACKEKGQAFSFSRVDQLPDKEGFLPFGIIS